MTRRLKLLFVMGEGGHSKECLRLIDLLGPAYAYAYILVHGDEITASKITIPGPIYRVIRPREKVHNLPKDIAKNILCALQALHILVRERPQAVISTGPAVAVPVAAMARLLRVKVIFIETGSRIHRLSTTGRMMRHLAHLYFVQWQELLPAVPEAIFAGRLF
jgi:UDP-N-acetylglucosamine:LPS N-acetylglucosamine transferase